MLIVTGLAGLSFVFAVWNLSQGDIGNAVVCFIFAGLVGSFAYFLSRVNKGATEFLTFVAQNKERLEAGETIDYRGTRVSSATEVTRFYFAVSLVFISTKNPTGFYIRGRDNTLFAGLMCSLATLVLGWWGFPWGPIYSCQALYQNSRGGKIQSVGQLLPQLQFVPAGATQPQSLPQSGGAPPIAHPGHSTNQNPWS